MPRVGQGTPSKQQSASHVIWATRVPSGGHSIAHEEKSSKTVI